MPHPESETSRAVFLDKDGTLIKDVFYNVDPDKVIFEAGVFNGLQTLQENGYKLAIISNQPGLAIGKFSQDQLDNLIEYFYDIFRKNSLELSGFYYCPHAPVEQGGMCECRKPKPGLLIQAANEIHVDLAQSWMIGDILNDVEAGNRAGCRTILIDNGNETEWIEGPFRKPDYTAKGFLDAADYINTKTLAANV